MNLQVAFLAVVVVLFAIVILSISLFYFFLGTQSRNYIYRPPHLISPEAFCLIQAFDLLFAI